MMDKRSNGGPTLDMNGIFEPGDLLILIEALSYKSAEALLTGGKDATGRLHALVDRLMEMSPLPEKSRGSEMGWQWFRVCNAAKTCRGYLAFVTQGKISNWKTMERECHLDVVVDDRFYRFVENGTQEDLEPHIERIEGWLRELAPIDAERLAVLTAEIDLGPDFDVSWAEWSEPYREEVARLAGEKLRSALSDITDIVSVRGGNPVMKKSSVHDIVFAVPAAIVDRVAERVKEMAASEKEIRTEACERKY